MRLSWASTMYKWRRVLHSTVRRLLAWQGRHAHLPASQTQSPRCQSESCTCGRSSGQLLQVEWHVWIKIIRNSKTIRCNFGELHSVLFKTMTSYLMPSKWKMSQTRKHLWQRISPLINFKKVKKNSAKVGLCIPMLAFLLLSIAANDQWEDSAWLTSKEGLGEIVTHQ